MSVFPVSLFHLPALDWRMHSAVTSVLFIDTYLVSTSTSDTGGRRLPLLLMLSRTVYAALCMLAVDVRRGLTCLFHRLQSDGRPVAAAAGAAPSAAATAGEDRHRLG